MLIKKGGSDDSPSSRSSPSYSRPENWYVLTLHNKVTPSPPPPRRGDKFRRKHHHPSRNYSCYLAFIEFRSNKEAIETNRRWKWPFKCRIDKKEVFHIKIKLDVNIYWLCYVISQSACFIYLEFWIHVFIFVLKHWHSGVCLINIHVFFYIYLSSNTA